MALPELYSRGREGKWFGLGLFSIYMIDAVYQVIANFSPKGLVNIHVQVCHYLLLRHVRIQLDRVTYGWVGDCKYRVIYREFSFNSASLASLNQF